MIFDTPYYAVIFSSKKSENLKGYAEMNAVIYDEVEQIEGYLGYENVGDQDGNGIHISYWKDMDAIEHWKQNSLHHQAKKKGKSGWYDRYEIKICKVESNAGFKF